MWFGCIRPILRHTLLPLFRIQNLNLHLGWSNLFSQILPPQQRHDKSKESHGPQLISCSPLAASDFSKARFLRSPPRWSGGTRSSVSTGAQRSGWATRKRPRHPGCPHSRHPCRGKATGSHWGHGDGFLSGFMALSLPHGVFRGADGRWH